MEDALRKENVDAFVLALVDVEIPNSTKLEKLKTIKTILQKSITSLSATIQEEERKNASIIDLSDSAVFTLEQAQMLEPRGRFKVVLSVEGMSMTGKSGVLNLQWDQISIIAQVPNANCTKKDGEDILFLHLKDVSYMGKPLQNLVWNLNKQSKEQHKATYGPMHYSGSECTVATSVVEALSGITIAKPQAHLFTSLKQLCYLRCHKGTQEGVLYPLQCGVLFLKPALFIPASEVASIAAGRGGAAQTRYIDIQIETESGKSFEFTNVERDEIPSLQAYVQYYVRLRKRQEKQQTATSVPPAANIATVLEDDSESDDGDYDPNASDSEEEGSVASEESDCSVDSQASDSEEEEHASKKRKVEIIE